MQAAAAAPSVQAAPPPSVQAAAPSPGASRPPDGRPGAALALAGVARLFPTTDSALYGAALEADIPLPLPRAPGVSWGGDLAGGLASSERPLGRARAIDLSASIRMAARRAFGPLALDGGVGWRLGWTRLSGTSTQRGAVVRTGAHLWTGPLAHGGAQLRVAGRLVLGARLELGHVLRPVKARIGTTTALGMGGPWIALGIGAGVNFR
jgi:hypothetical protein